MKSYTIRYYSLTCHHTLQHVESRDFLFTTLKGVQRRAKRFLNSDIALIAIFDNRHKLVAELLAYLKINYTLNHLKPERT